MPNCNDYKHYCKKSCRKHKKYYHKKCHCHCKKKKLDEENILLDIPATGTPGYTITYDAYGIPTVVADNVYEAYKGAAYASVKDRLYQFWTARYLVSTGQLSSILGPSFLASDKRELDLKPDETQMLADYATFSPLVKASIDGTLDGINERINEVLGDLGNLLPLEFSSGLGGLTLPFLPHTITLTEFLTLFAFLYRVTRPARSPDTQVLTAEIVSGIGMVAPPSITKQLSQDIFGTTPNRLSSKKTLMHSIDNCEYTVILPDPPASNPRSLPKGSDKSLRTTKSVDIVSNEDFHNWAKASCQANKDREELFKKYAINISPGSWGACLSGDMMLDGNPVVIGASQQPSELPDDFYLVNIKVKVDNNIVHEVRGIAFLGIGPISNSATIRNGNYTYAAYSQQTGQVGRDGILMSTVAETSVVRTENINVLGVGVVPHEIRRANTLSSYITGEVTIPGVSFGHRTPFIDRELKGAGLALQTNFARTPLEFRTLINNIEIEMPFQVPFADNRGNYAALLTAGILKLPNTVNRMFIQLSPLVAPSIDPNGFFSIAPPTSEYVYIPPPFDQNRPEGYYCSWNDQFANGYPQFFFGNARNGYQGMYLEKNLRLVTENFTKKLSYFDLKEFIYKSTNYQGGTAALAPGVSNGQGGLGIPSELYTPALLAAIDGDTLTPDRITAKNILLTFEGKYVDESDMETILCNPDISDGWMLYNSYISALTYNILTPIFGPGTFIALPTPSDPITFDGTTAIVFIMGVIAEALGLGVCGNNNLKFPLWLGGNSPETVMLGALDFAIANLKGANPTLEASRPLGLGLRPVTTHGTSFTVANPELVVEGSLLLNRSSYYTIVDLGESKTTVHVSRFGGQSGTITGNVSSPVFDKHYTDMLEKHFHFDLTTDEPLIYGPSKKQICKKKKKLKRIKHTYEPHPLDTGFEYIVGSGNCCDELY